MEPLESPPANLVNNRFNLQDAFPEDVPTAPLTRILLSDLLTSDSSATVNQDDATLPMFEACKNLGFFYLDLRNTREGEALRDDAEKLFKVQDMLFKLPAEEKQHYDLLARGMQTYFGYKGIGTSFADSSRGIKDRNEFWNISQDDVLGHTAPLPAPPILNVTRALQASFIRNAHTIATRILSTLNTHLNLPPDTLPSLHRLPASSDSQIRLLHAPPQPPDDLGTALGAHTDFGSLTILFTHLGGLQVLPDDSSEWLYVQPLPGHAIVNIGDALGSFSNGVVKSNLHRVVSPPGAQAGCDRLSLMYFLRPGDEVVLRSLGGEEGNGVIPELGEGRGEELTSRQVIDKTLKGRGRGGKVVEGEEKLYWEK